MQAVNKVAKNTAILYAKMAITVFISLYSTRLILGALGVADFGLFNVVGGAIAMLGFLNSSMASASQRFMSYAQGAGNVYKLKNIFNVSIVLHIIIAIIVLVILEAAGLVFFNGVLNIPADRVATAKIVYQFMIVSTLFTIISVPYDAVINAHENMLLVAIIGIIDAGCKLGIALYVTQTGLDKLVMYGLLMAILAVFLLIVQRIYCNRTYSECDIQLNNYFDKSIFKEMTSFAGWNLLGSASSMIAGYGSGILLNHFFGTVLNAANAIAGQLNGQLMALTNTMQKALNPMITKSEGSGNREQMVKATLSGSKISFLIFAIFSIPFLIETPFILKLWLKNIPEWTVIFCQLGIVYSLIQQITITLGTAIAAVGNIKRVNMFNSIITTVNLLVLFILFKIGKGPYFLPVISIIVTIVIDLMKLYYAKQYCGINYGIFFKEVFSRVLLVFTISFLIGMLPLFFMPQSILRLVLVCFMSTATYILVSFLLAFSESEKRILKNLQKSVFARIKY
jgi:O-antigen/teichoic acid export membrane protein